jgi:hypothetical protein
MARKKTAPTPDAYDFNDAATVDFLTAQKHKFEALRDKSASEANNTERSLSGQLILLTTVLISVNVIALGNDGLLTSLTLDQKLLVITAFILETVAVIAGVYHYFKMESSYNKWADAYHEVTLIFDKREFGTEGELASKVSEAQSDLDIHPPRPALRIQVGCIIASFAAYAVLIVALFFDFHNLFYC